MKIKLVLTDTVPNLNTKSIKIAAAMVFQNPSEFLFNAKNESSNNL